MDADRWTRVKGVFQAALAQPSEGRDAFLRDACASDATLRSEVESLLAAHDQAGAFAEGAALDRLTPSAAEAALIALNSVGRTLQRGDRLGKYEITAFLDAGGMGEVYKGYDTRLNRGVAIKTLPLFAAADTERARRFEQEARATAATNHPNILVVYDVGTHHGVPFIVSELLDGTSLRDQLRRGRLPLRQAIDWTLQIVRGLAAAHEKGIVHGDLKPENIFITRDGVKILDFGLARLTQTDHTPHDAGGLTANATKTAPGVIVGTVDYMSPEQVRGIAADHRADIFAVGAILYEAVSGRHPFRGDTAPDTMSAILNLHPDLSAADHGVPPVIARIVERCLQKDASARFQAATDLGFALEALTESSATLSARPQPSRGMNRTPWAIIGVVTLVAILLAAARLRRDSTVDDTPAYRAALVLPAALAGSAGNRFALSANGRQVAYVAPNTGGRPTLWVRSLDSTAAQPLAGTEGASGPFWSPDGRALAFTSGGKLKRIEASGGPVLVLCDAAYGAPGAWSRDDEIIFTPAARAPLFRVSAAGGIPSQVTELDTAAGEERHSYPFFLPDGKRFLYLATSGGGGARGVFVGSLGSNNRTQVLDGTSNAQYAGGSLIFARNTTLVALPFNLATMSPGGAETPLAQQVAIGVNSRAAGFAVTDAAIVYQEGSISESSLVWMDRRGSIVRAVGEAAPYSDVSLSPDGRYASTSVAQPGSNPDIWVVDLHRGVRTRFTSDSSDDGYTIWSPDGSRIVFNSRRGGFLDLYEKEASGTSREELVWADKRDKFPVSWSADGQFILVSGVADSDLWVLPRVKGRRPFPFLQTPFSEVQGQFSPDGRWVAYVSNESGGSEVYITSFPDAGWKVRVSPAGGNWPRWGRDGKELFFMAGSALTAASVSSLNGRAEIGAITRLFDVRSGGIGPFYNVAPDGRFLINIGSEDTKPVPLTLLLNWHGLVPRSQR